MTPSLPAHSGGYTDAFVSKLDAAGSALLYSTYLGGSARDAASGIAVDGAGRAYVTGLTRSANFPTVNPLQAAYGGGEGDAFVTKLNATGTALVYAHYLGGTSRHANDSNDKGRRNALDAAGRGYLPT